MKRARRSSLSGPLALMKKCICSVTFRTAVQFDTAIVEDEGEAEETICRTGTGLILTSQVGQPVFILTDRTTVPQRLGDIEVTLGDLSRGAAVVFVHPLHNFVVLRLDEDAEQAGQKFGEAVSFEDKHFDAGDDADFVGFDGRGQLFHTSVKVQAVRLGEFPQSKAWREKNLEAIVLTDAPEQATGGVLCDKIGQVTAIYALGRGVEDNQVMRYNYCLPVYLLTPILESLQSGGTTIPAVPSLEVEFKHAELQRLRRLPARIRPPASWLKKLAELGETALKVSSITTGGPCAGHLAEADLLVAVDGETVCSVRDIDEKLQEAVSKAPKGAELIEVKLTLLRGGKERHVDAKVPLLGSDGARRVLCWHGLVLQEMPRSARELGPVPQGVYISRQMLGSPAEADGIEGEFLVAVDGKPTPTLDAILAMDEGQKSKMGEQTRHLRVETVDPCGRHFVATLQPDPLFWGTFELAQDENGVFSFIEHGS